VNEQASSVLIANQQQRSHLLLLNIKYNQIKDKQHCSSCSTSEAPSTHNKRHLNPQHSLSQRKQVPWHCVMFTSQYCVNEHPSSTSEHSLKHYGTFCSPCAICSIWTPEYWIQYQYRQRQEFSWSRH